MQINSFTEDPAAVPLKCCCYVLW